MIVKDWNVKYLQNVIKRSDETGVSNHFYLSYNQLKARTDKCIEQIDKFRLETLNLIHEIISIRSKNSDVMWMVHLIAMNVLPRVNEILKTCKKAKFRCKWY